MRHVLAGSVSKPQSMPARSASSDMPSTCVRFRMVSSRSVGPAGRDREAAVADHRRRDAERRRGPQRRVPGDLRVEVGVAVDDAGHSAGRRHRSCALPPRAELRADDSRSGRRDATSPRTGLPVPSTTRRRGSAGRLTPSSAAARANSASISRRSAVGGVDGVHRHVGPGQALALLHRPQQLDVVREAERQAADAASTSRPAAACPRPCSRLRRRASRRA